MTCSACGFESPEGMRFCGRCGADLGAVTAEPPRPETPGAERRHLTVLFCDLVDSTELTAALDPEELRDVITRYQEVADDAVRRFGGYVAQYQGDGIVVYFGYPRAQEGDPRRAVHAALDIIEGVERLNSSGSEEGRISLAVRVGIEAGHVVTGEVGSGERHEPTALGPALNLAARLQELAEAGSVIVGPAAHRLTSGFFTYEPLGPLSLKGIPEPTEAFRVLAATGARSRFDVELSRGLTPMVGRTAELELLRARFARVREGVGRVILVGGEAGIGKSRILQIFREQTPGAEWLVTRCSPLYTRSPLNPIIDMLRGAFQVDEGGDPGRQLQRLERGMEGVPLPTSETVPLLAQLLSIPLEGRFPALMLSPEKQKERTIELLIRMLRWRTERGPVVFAVEDLHWADPSTLELLDRVVRECAADRVMSLLTHRPGYEHPWSDRDDVEHIRLVRLGPADTRSVVEGITGGRTLPDEVLAEIEQKTEGVPLFVVELTKTILESGALRVRNGGYEIQGNLEALAIPDTLHDSLMARLDRLQEAKAVAQVGSVLGREFPRALLERVTEADRGDLGAHLDRLVEAELLVRFGDGDEATYVFSHALIQDAAYGSLLRRTRRALHERTARTLEAALAEGGEVQPELLAYHFSEAGLPAEAVKYWQMAGERAIGRSALKEALEHLSEGLTHLEKLPEGPERLQAELALRTTVGSALMHTSGYASSEVERTFSRARDICDELGQPARLFPVLLGLWAYYCNTARYEVALGFGRRVMEIAESRGDADVMEAHYEIGQILTMQGRLGEAEEHFRAGIGLDGPRRERSQAYVTGTDPGVSNLAWLAQTTWMRGRPDEARRHADAAVGLARSLVHPYSLGFGLVLASWTYYLCGDMERVLELSGEAVALSSEQGFPYLGLLTGQLQHRARLHRALGARDEEAARQALAGITMAHEAIFAIGARFAETQILSASIEAQLTVGGLDEASELLERAFAGAESTGEGQFHAELLRYRAALTLARRGAPRAYASAAEDLRAALELAREQGARSFELRAATDLAELWSGAGRLTEAREMLSETYASFDEGRDTADLVRAAALLRNLGP